MTWKHPGKETFIQNLEQTAHLCSVTVKILHSIDEVQELIFFCNFACLSDMKTAK